MGFLIPHHEAQEANSFSSEGPSRILDLDSTGTLLMELPLFGSTDAFRSDPKQDKSLEAGRSVLRGASSATAVHATTGRPLLTIRAFC